MLISHTNYTLHILSFLNYLRYERRYSENTIGTYDVALRQFFDHCSAYTSPPSFDEISHHIVRSWLADLKKQENNTRTIRLKISTLKSFFKYLLKQGTVAKTPMSSVILPKINKRLPSFVEEKDMKTLRDYVEFSDDWKGKTERLVLQLFYFTGMRLSELINLKESQLDASYGQLKVLGKGNKERIIPVEKNLMEELQAYIKEKPVRIENVHNVFVRERGLPLYPVMVRNLVKANLQKITTIQKKSPHVLRHTFATHLVNGGANLNAVKDLLGHSSLAATQVYTHNTIDKLKKVFEQSHPKA